MAEGGLSMKNPNNVSGAMPMFSIILPAYFERQLEVLKSIFLGMIPYIDLQGKSVDEAFVNFLSLLGAAPKEGTEPIFWKASIAELQYLLYIIYKGNAYAMDCVNPCFRIIKNGEWKVPKLSCNREVNLTKFFEPKKKNSKYALDDIVNNALEPVGYRLARHDSYDSRIIIIKTY